MLKQNQIKKLVILLLCCAFFSLEAIHATECPRPNKSISWFMDGEEEKPIFDEVKKQFEKVGGKKNHDPLVEIVASYLAPKSYYLNFSFPIERFFENYSRCYEIPDENHNHYQGNNERRCVDCTLWAMELLLSECMLRFGYATLGEKSEEAYNVPSRFKKRKPNKKFPYELTVERHRPSIMLKRIADLGWICACQSECDAIKNKYLNTSRTAPIRLLNNKVSHPLKTQLSLNQEAIGKLIEEIERIEQEEERREQDLEEYKEPYHGEITCTPDQVQEMDPIYLLLDDYSLKEKLVRWFPHMLFGVVCSYMAYSKYRKMPTHHPNVQTE